nr:MAG TPA: hypothetical protein [Caudoviricetes sp.]
MGRHARRSNTPQGHLNGALAAPPARGGTHAHPRV